MRRFLFLAMTTGALALPATAAAHSTITIQGADILYTSEDAVSDNKLVVDETATSIRFRDPEADAGIQGPASCTPGATDSAGNPIEMTCPKTGLRRLTVDLGPNEDSMVANVSSIVVGATGVAGADNLKVVGPTADLLSGEQGNDVLDGGEGDDDLRGDDGSDTITGGGGKDTIQAGPGADTVDAGEGDDTINVPDGSADRVTCGGGTDTVRADTVDEIAADCENVERTFIAPPSGGDQGSAEDKTKPRLQSGGSTVQKVSRRRRLIRIAASLSEQGEVAASGFLDAGGINTPVKTKDYDIGVAGGGVTIVVRFSKRQMRLIMRDLNRRRKVFVRVNVVGSDRAGNTSVSRTLRIRLRK